MTKNVYSDQMLESLARMMQDYGFTRAKANPYGELILTQDIEFSHFDVRCSYSANTDQLLVWIVGQKDKAHLYDGLFPFKDVDDNSSWMVWVHQLVIGIIR